MPNSRANDDTRSDGPLLSENAETAPSKNTRTTCKPRRAQRGDRPGNVGSRHGGATDETVSLFVVEPTVTASGMQPGALTALVNPSLPEAIVLRCPCCASSG